VRCGVVKHRIQLTIFPQAMPYNASQNCPVLQLLSRGKVRDVYAIPDHPDVLLFVATDRISAFDVVMASAIPGKGKILTQLSMFWFDLLRDVVPNHVVTDKLADMPSIVHQYAAQLEGRSLLVRKLAIFPVEAIVRGYIAGGCMRDAAFSPILHDVLKMQCNASSRKPHTGSAWEEYRRQGTVCDIAIEAGMQESQPFPGGPLFTPSTKAEIGGHDENIHPDKMRDFLGAEAAANITRTSLLVFQRAAEYAAQRGIIIADTKFEFGADPVTGQVVLADEVLTPDSSRFWPASKYAVGRGQKSYDKQYVRDYLKSIDFDRKTSVKLPQEILQGTMRKYVEAFRLLTGRDPVL
jgi:phosphoribosylaminoimidazole-succinocarboxamide synthase